MSTSRGIASCSWRTAPMRRSPGWGRGSVILDTSWTPLPGDRSDLVALRRVVARVLDRVDLGDEAQRRLDGWGEAARIADRMTVGGVSWWFRIRPNLAYWLQERLLWRHVLAELGVGCRRPSDRGAVGRDPTRGGRPPDRRVRPTRSRGDRRGVRDDDRRGRIPRSAMEPRARCDRPSTPPSPTGLESGSPGPSRPVAGADGSATPRRGPAGPGPGGQGRGRRTTDGAPARVRRRAISS